jgi:hypothetical protein
VTTHSGVEYQEFFFEHNEWVLNIVGVVHTDEEFKVTENAPWEEIRSVTIQRPGLRYALIADYVSKAIASGQADSRRDCYLVIDHYRSHSEFRICESVDPLLIRRRTCKQHTLLSKFRIRLPKRTPSLASMPCPYQEGELHDRLSA